MSIDGISVHTQRFDPELTELCHAAWSCEFASLISDVLFLIVAGALALLVLTVLSNLRAGIDIVEEEQSRTAAERDAFYEFAERVNELSPDTRGRAGGTNGSAVASAVAVAKPHRSRAKIRDAYRETVMSVPHFDLDYDEALEENMAIELGDDIAAAIEGGQGLSPILQQLLVSKARAAAAERERLISMLEDEAEALENARNTLSAIESDLKESKTPTRLDELAERWDRLDELEARCDDLAQTRQYRLARGGTEGEMDTPSLSEYLYSSLPVEHPILADTVAVVERIDSARQALVSSAMRRA